MTLENVWARVSIVRIALFSNAAERDVFVQGEIAGYRLVEALDPGDGDDEISRNLRLRKKYRLLMIFADFKTNNKLSVYLQRCEAAESIPAVCLVFDSSYYNPLKFEDVLFVQNHFKRNYGLKFRVSEFHVATDLISPMGKDSLHPEVYLSIKAGEEDNPPKVTANETLIFGSLRSVTRLVVYDKAKQLLRTEGITLKEQVSRIEIRFNDHRFEDRNPTLLHELTNWSWLYGEHFSFHEPRRRLMKALGIDALGWPIWKRRDLIFKRHGVTASEFYGKYLKEHRKLSKPVRKALAEYWWQEE